MMGGDLREEERGGEGWRREGEGRAREEKGKDA